MVQLNNEAIHGENIEGQYENQKESEELYKKKAFLVLLEKGRFFRMSP